MKRLGYIFACICLGASAGTLAVAAAPGRAGAGGARGPAARGAAPAPAAPVAPPTPEEVGSFYQTTIDHYLSGEWQTLADDITRNVRLQNALSKEQQAEITYIKTAVTDGRPVWWDKVKSGQKQDLTAKFWGATVQATWDPDAKGLQVTNTQGRRTITINWNHLNMDSAEQAEHGFTKGELVDTGVWAMLELARLYGPQTYQNLSGQSEEYRKKLMRYAELRGMMTAGYYGTPRARRWACWLCLSAYSGAHQASETYIQRKPMGAMLVAEIVGHPWKYPSIRYPNDVPADNAEGALATALIGQIERVKLTFAEDKALRDAIKEFATVNSAGVFNTAKVVLWNKLPIPLEPAQDTDMAAKRNAWLMEQLQNPATQPATTQK